MHIGRPPATAGHTSRRGYGKACRWRWSIASAFVQAVTWDGMIDRVAVARSHQRYCGGVPLGTGPLLRCGRSTASGQSRSPARASSGTETLSCWRVDAQGILAQHAPVPGQLSTSRSTPPRPTRTTSLAVVRVTLDAMLTHGAPSSRLIGAGRPVDAPALAASASTLAWRERRCRPRPTSGGFWLFVSQRNAVLRLPTRTRMVDEEEKEELLARVGPSWPPCKPRA